MISKEKSVTISRGGLDLIQHSTGTSRLLANITALPPNLLSLHQWPTKTVIWRKSSVYSSFRCPGFAPGSVTYVYDIQLIHGGTNCLVYKRIVSKSTVNFNPIFAGYDICKFLVKQDGYIAVQDDIPILVLFVSILRLPLPQICRH